MNGSYLVTRRDSNNTKTINQHRPHLAFPFSSIHSLFFSLYYFLPQPDTIPGDVVVVLQQIDHPVFKREGIHLIVKKTIQLVEALVGFSFYLTHLDGRVLHIKSEPGQILKPGDVKCVKNEGMPHSKNHFERGHLFVEFTIKFPDSHTLAAPALKHLISAFGAPEKPVAPPPSTTANQYNVDMNTEDGELPASSTQVPQEPEDVFLSDVDIHEERSRAEQADKEAYEEDEDEDHHHGARPGCRTQ